jgi:SepF-like predicted cell division protein (DUF552 family)
MLQQINPPLVNEDFIYIYKYENRQIVERTQEEIEKDLQAISKEISQEYSVMLNIDQLYARREQDKIQTQLAIAELANYLTKSLKKITSETLFF